MSAAHKPRDVFITVLRTPRCVIDEKTYIYRNIAFSRIEIANDRPFPGVRTIRRQELGPRRLSFSESATWEVCSLHLGTTKIFQHVYYAYINIRVCTRRTNTFKNYPSSTVFLKLNNVDNDSRKTDGACFYLTVVRVKNRKKWD